MQIIAPEVSQALAEGRPVVALESTLVSHGLPWPENLETATAVEAAVRDAGATPATIAVMGGRIRLGLSAAEREQLARSGSFVKASRRDLGSAVARGLNAATTVSATLWIARTRGIAVLATGGLGGVHRDASTSFDISNDLDELARADGTAVVCSGVKSILDMAATLDALETRGVAVVGYRTDTLPAFTTASSGLPLDSRVDGPEEAAALVRAHRALGLPGAVVLAQPVPEHVALDRAEMESALEAALAEARARGVAGKAVTPFLLDRLRFATEGRSLLANRALVVANARLAGEVASALSNAAARP
jgi:pseudouridine-5'-phosphate glycosidase